MKMVSYTLVVFSIVQIVSGLTLEKTAKIKRWCGFTMSKDSCQINNELRTSKFLRRFWKIHKKCSGEPTVLNPWWSGLYASIKKFVNLTRTVSDILLMWCHKNVFKKDMVEVRHTPIGSRASLLYNLLNISTIFKKV